MMSQSNFKGRNSPCKIIIITCSASFTFQHTEVRQIVVWMSFTQSCQFNKGFFFALFYFYFIGNEPSGSVTYKLTVYTLHQDTQS